MERPLILAHYYPPLGGAGVQRTVKLVKNLAGRGLSPVVITSARGAESRWEPIDASLCKDIPDSIRTYRSQERFLRRESSRWMTRTRRLLRLEDPSRRRWINSLRETAETAQMECGCDWLLVTMSPFEMAEVGAAMSRNFSIPWIADLRDPWALDEVQVYPTAFHRRLELAKMRRLLSTACLVVLNTPEALKLFLKSFPEFKQKAVICVTNGYDEDDFTGATPFSADGNFNIVHTGYLHTAAGRSLGREKWLNSLLGRTRMPIDLLTRSHVYLLAALEQMAQEEPQSMSAVKVHLVGVLSEADRACINASRVKDVFVLHGYQTHEISIRWLLSADMLFLPMHNVPADAASSIVPGKTYEYMATGRPILAAVPRGDTKEFVQRCGTGTTCRPDDVESIVRTIKHRYSEWKMQKAPPLQNTAFVRQFERKILTAQLLEAVNGAVSSAANYAASRSPRKIAAAESA